MATTTQLILEGLGVPTSVLLFSRQVFKAYKGLPPQTRARLWCAVVYVLIGLTPQREQRETARAILTDRINEDTRSRGKRTGRRSLRSNLLEVFFQFVIVHGWVRRVIEREGAVAFTLALEGISFIVLAYSGGPVSSVYVSITIGVLLLLGSIAYGYELSRNIAWVTRTSTKLLLAVGLVAFVAAQPMLTTFGIVDGVLLVFLAAGLLALIRWQRGGAITVAAIMLIKGTATIVYYAHALGDPRTLISWIQAWLHLITAIVLVAGYGRVSPVAPADAAET